MPHITKNLLSFSRITKDNNVMVEFYADKCIIKDICSQATLLEGHLRDGQYQLNIFTFLTS